MPRKNSDNGDNDGDVEMDYKEAVKAITIKKRKDAGDKKKRYIIPLVKFQKYCKHRCISGTRR